MRIGTGADPARGAGIGRRNDVILAATCLAGGVVSFGVGAYGTPRGVGAAWLLAPLAVVCGALLLRRLAPLPAVVVGLAAAAVDQVLGGSLATLVILAELIYEVTVYAREWLARSLVWVMSGLTVVVAAVALVRYDSQAGAGAGITAGLVLVTPVVTAITVRQYRDRAVAERQRAEQTARLAELDRRQAVAAERATMARELHDVVANHFSAVAIHATAALSGRDRPAGTVHDALVTIRESSLSGLAEMRRMVTILRGASGGIGGDGEPPGSHTRPGLCELDLLLDRARAAGLQVDAEIAGDWSGVPAAIDLAAYRIAQESLTNAARHSPSGRVRVAVTAGPGGVRLTVDSWPAGRPAAAPVRGSVPGSVPVPGSGSEVGLGSGMGLIGMRERATLLGGEFSAGPHEGAWRVSAHLPTVEHQPPTEPGATATTGAGATATTEAGATAAVPA